MGTIRHNASIALALAVGACAACSTTPPPTQPAHPVEPGLSAEVIQRALDASINLYRVDGDGGKMICSGVRVSPTRIVTAYHCVLEAALPYEMLQLAEVLDPTLRHTELDGLVGTKEYFNTNAGEDAQTATVLAVDAAHDIAILSTARSVQPRVRLRAERGAVGMPVFAIGNPLGLEQTFTRGWLSYSCRKDDGVCWSQLDLTIAPGSSGGGLYDADGNLMGLASSIMLMATASGHDGSGVPIALFSDPQALFTLVDANT